MKFHERNVNLLAVGVTLTAWTPFSLSLPAHGYIEDYLPQQVRQSMKRVPQKKLASIETNQKLQVASVDLADDTDGFVIKGKTTAGESWVIKRDPIGFGGTVYQADVDSNGQPDLLLISNTAACGIAPPRAIMVVLFDKQHLPTAYEIVGYFNETRDEKAIEDLVKLSPSSPPVLLQQRLVYANVAGKDRHYWRWEVYRAVNGKFAPWDTTLAGCKFPCYVWYTQKANHKVSTSSATLEKTTQKEHYIAPVLKVEKQ